MGNKAIPTTVTGLLLGILALAGQLVPPTAHAAGRVALIIGNANYKDAPLRNPVNDARAMATTLENLGFEVIRVENASKETMERAIGRFTGRLEEDSSGLFYYAGHGVQVRGRNYLVPVDAQINSERDARIESVSINLVLDELEYAGNRVNVVILDACRNNPFERRLRGASRGLAAVDAARGTLIAYATSPGSVAQDGDGRNGLYTEELLSALQISGLKVEEVFKQIRVEVSRRTGGLQVPWESSSLTGDFIFNRSMTAEKSTSSQAASGHEALFWQSIKDSDDPALFTAYLDQYPQGAFVSIARVRRDALQRRESPSKKMQPRAGQPIKVAILPTSYFWPGSTNYIDLDPDTGPVKTLTSTLKHHARVGIVYSYYSPPDPNPLSEPESVWTGGLTDRTPMIQRLSEFGTSVDADVVVMMFYKNTGVFPYGDSYKFKLYLYDVRSESLNRFEGEDRNMTETVRGAIDAFGGEG